MSHQSVQVGHSHIAALAIITASKKASPVTPDNCRVAAAMGQTYLVEYGGSSHRLNDGTPSIS